MTKIKEVARGYRNLKEGETGVYQLTLATTVNLTTAYTVTAGKTFYLKKVIWIDEGNFMHRLYLNNLAGLIFQAHHTRSEQDLPIDINIDFEIPLKFPSGSVIKTKASAATHTYKIIIIGYEV